MSRNEDLLIEMVKVKPALAQSEHLSDVSLLHLAAKYGFTQLTQYLLEKELIDVNVRDGKNQTPLHYGVIDNKPKVIEILLNFNCDTKLKDIDGNLAIDIARRCKNEEVIKLFQLKAE